ncbi:hypothetical protein EHS25_001600 [Saitozyma podzolica]|uniref:Uncharacterized protein n=1 Tax=Saitozyma podzolica TaxID=1890683 RepID=A0A427YGM7_9TREE|nr:hypothetical protein EHS25_001600 [Saitozyma podzolica]
MSTISPSSSSTVGVPPPPALLLAVFRPLPVSLARTRLKSNFLALLLSSFVQTLFTPYLSIRRSVIYLIDEHVQHRVGGQGSYAAGGFWWLESAVTFILIWNMLEAAVSIKWPRQSATAVPQGLKMTPSRPSSPLAWPHDASFLPHSLPYSPFRDLSFTPSCIFFTLSPLASPMPLCLFFRSSYPLTRSQPDQSRRPSPADFDLADPRIHHSRPLLHPLQVNAPPPILPPTILHPSQPGSIRFHALPFSQPASSLFPLSASTAKILNLPSRAPESTGLFFDPNASASPSKLAQSQMQQSQPQLQNQNGITQRRNEVAVTGTGTGRTVQTGTGEFVLIEGAEREWVDNVWKGVRGKGGRVGI